MPDLLYNRIDKLEEQMETRVKVAKVMLKFSMKQAKDKNVRLDDLEEQMEGYRAYCYEMWEKVKVLEDARKISSRRVSELNDEVQELNDRIDFLKSVLDKQGNDTKPVIQAFLYGTPPKI